MSLANGLESAMHGVAAEQKNNRVDASDFNG